jgi:two-component sensor histidine kinase
VARDLLSGVELDAQLLNVLFQGVDHGFCLCEVVVDADGRPADYRFLSVNALFEELTGLSDPVGRTALELVPDLERHWIDSYGTGGLEGTTLRFEREAESMGRAFRVFAAPMGPRGRFAIVFREVTAERRLADDRERALRRAEALLEEVNHRVMNSLGMIAAIVGLEARARAEGAGRRAMERIAERVQAVADLYRALGVANSETAVRADAYLERVLSRLSAAIADGRNVRIESEIAPVELPTGTAVPVGLMVNELVTNSLKYAFAESGGRVRVTLAREGDSLRLVVADDGRGMAADPDDGGIGRKLVAAFAQQIDGTVELAPSVAGAAVTVEFPAPQPATG